MPKYPLSVRLSHLPLLNILDIIGLARDKGTPGIEPRSPDPQSSPLPLHHHSGHLKDRD